MTDEIDQRHDASHGGRDDEAPGEAPGDDAPDLGIAIAKYAAGLAISIVLTLASFWAAGTDAVWAPGIPVLLAALAVGQMGVHLVFFLHVSSGPESTNNILALAFGVFVVGLVVFGSIVIMGSLDANMTDMPMPVSTQPTMSHSTMPNR